MREGARASLVQECSVCGRRLFLRVVGRGGLLGVWRHETNSYEERVMRRDWIARHLRAARDVAGLGLDEVAVVLRTTEHRVHEADAGTVSRWGGALDKPEAVAWIASLLPIVPNYHLGGGKSVERHRCRYRPLVVHRPTPSRRKRAAALHSDEWGRKWEPGDDAKDGGE